MAGVCDRLGVLAVRYHNNALLRIRICCRALPDLISSECQDIPQSRVTFGAQSVGGPSEVLQDMSDWCDNFRLRRELDEPNMCVVVASQHAIDQSLKQLLQNVETCELAVSLVCLGLSNQHFEYEILGISPGSRLTVDLFSLQYSSAVGILFDPVTEVLPVKVQLDLHEANFRGLLRECISSSVGRSNSQSICIIR